jgi:antitoxin VapB
LPYDFNFTLTLQDLMLRYVSMIYILVSEVIMEIAKVFQTGRSQAVRLPKAFRFNGTEVAIKSFGRGVLLMPIDNPWDVMLEAINEFEVGFQLERADQGEQLREEFR